MSSLPIIETVISIITTVLSHGGYAAIVALMLVESFGIPPLPSEIILPFTGFLVALGTFSFWAALAAALVGSVLGSYAGYAVGRWGRGWITGRGPKWLQLKPEHLERMDRWFVRWGQSIVFTARLLPVVRSYISYPAGTARMDPLRFGVYTAVGATPFTAALIYAGVVLGSNWNALVPYFQYADYGAVAALVLTVGWVVLRWRHEERRLRDAAPHSE